MMETNKKNCKERPHQHHHPQPAAGFQNSSTLQSRSRTQQRVLPLMPPPPPPPPTTYYDQSVNFLKKNSPPSEQELKLAPLAISLNVRLRTSDMPVPMQEHALRYTRSLVGTSAAPPPQRLTPTLLARSLKKEFDGRYGPAWHCVVGKSFGSFVTHSAGGFVYFSLDSLWFLLFKTEVQLVKELPSPRP